MSYESDRREFVTGLLATADLATLSLKDLEGLLPPKNLRGAKTLTEPGERRCDRLPGKHFDPFVHRVSLYLPSNWELWWEYFDFNNRLGIAYRPGPGKRRKAFRLGHQDHVNLHFAEDVAKVMIAQAREIK